MLSPAHQQLAGWSPQRFLDWAGKIGPHTVAAIEHPLRSRTHPQQGYRSALGILRLAKTYTPARLEAACERAFAIQSVNYRSIDSILKKGLDRAPGKPVQASLPLEHHNVRGAAYYH